MGQPPLKLDQIKSIAAKKGGEFLGENYYGSKFTYSWKCAEGHVWETTGGQIVNKNQWCPTCAKQKLGRLITKQDAINLALEKGGRFLSEEYTKSLNKYIWSCSLGHVWETTYTSIKSGKWCPTCAKYGTSIGERICREIIECIFEKDFPKRRPKFLRVGRFSYLELDGYCEELNVAFEYQGWQHNQSVKHYGGDKFLEKQKLIDIEKEKLCKENNIKIIYVKEFKHKNNIDFCINGVLIALSCAGLSAPDQWVRPKNLSGIYEPLSFVYGKTNIKILNDIIQSKGGFLLSKMAMDQETKLLVDCGKGHQWNVTYRNLKAGNWCPECSRFRKNINELHEYAKSKEGLCLSEEFIGVVKKHKWQCAKGHIWDAVPSHVLNGAWCPVCGNQTPKTTNDMQIIAKSRGGKFLSEKMSGTKKKYKWECAKGHQWEAVAYSIQRGCWCPVCRERKPSKEINK